MVRFNYRLVLAYEPVSGRFWKLTQMLVLRNQVFSMGVIYAFGVFLPFIKAAVRYVPLVVVEQGVQTGEMQTN